MILLPVVVALAAGLPAGAGGQIDPDPDGIGIYADQAATLNHATLTPGVLAHVWVVFTRVSHSMGGYISGYEFLVSHTPNAQVIQWYLYDGTNFATPPDFVVGTPHEGWQVSPCMLMVRISYVVSDALPAAFFLAASPTFDVLGDGLPGYVVYVWDYFPLYPSSGGTGVPVFVINGEAPVAADARSWGGVKRLFD
jgi:hypothetical protein